MLRSQTLLATLLLSTALLSASAQACGRSENGDGTFKGNLDVLRQVFAKEANLACEQNGAFQRVTLEVRAIYRCLGSPVTAKLKFADGKAVDVLEMDAREATQLTFHAADKSHISCRIEALSLEEQEALNAKKEQEAKAKELAELKRKKETEETIAQIPRKALADFSNALFLKLADEQGYVLVSYTFTEAYALSGTKQTARFTAKIRKTGSAELEEAQGSAYFENGQWLRLYLY
jgi:hypothetical protein